MEVDEQTVTKARDTMWRASDTISGLAEKIIALESALGLEVSARKVLEDENQQLKAHHDRYHPGPCYVPTAPDDE
jgi:hypothetical protein